MIFLVYSLVELAESLRLNNSTDRFLSVEDQLLLIGLKKYGVGSWDSIQAQLIPTRTAKQLQIRFKNMTSRRAPANPLKEFNTELLKPLSRIEEEFLYRVYSTVGLNKY